MIEAQNAIEKQQGEINKSIGDKSRVDSMLAIVEKLLDAPEKYKAAVAEINPLADKVCDEYVAINQREVALEAMNELMDATMVDLTSMIAQLESKIAIEKAKLEEYKTVDLSNEEYLQLLKDTLKEYEAMIEQMEKKLDVIKAKIDAAIQENK